MATTTRSGNTSFAASAAGTPEAQGAGARRLKEAVGRPVLIEVGHEDAVLARIAGDDGVVRQHVSQRAKSHQTPSDLFAER
jgi:hypothetical protein